MPTNPPQSIPVTPAQRRIMETIKNELFPQIEYLKKLMVNIQACRVSYQLYSTKLNKLEKKYSAVSKDFFEVVRKLETPDNLFEGLSNSDSNVLAYFQFQGSFKQNISEGVGYIEIIDRTLDRKVGNIQNNRTLWISVAALVLSVYFAK